MTGYDAPLRDIQFILRHLVGIDEICGLEGFEDVTTDLVDAVLTEAKRFAEGVLAPLNRIGDIEGCQLGPDGVSTAPGWPSAYDQFREAGWVGLSMAPEFGGQGLPKAVAAPVTEMWYASNMAFSLLAPMAGGAVETLVHSVSPDLDPSFLANLVSGRWTAAMALTEPQSGSDLSAIRCQAAPHADGSYRISGQKIFITYGDLDLAENIIHLVLARLPDTPPGIRGISLFLVPKFLITEDGQLGARNDLRAISIEHKLGIHGSPTCTMSFGDDAGAIGYLVGESGTGLAQMFVMVNDSRFNVGLQGIACGDRALSAALAFAQERRQGRDAITGEANVPIVRHPDVKRTLRLMRAKVMASRMLAYTVAGYADRGSRSADAAVSAKYRSLVDLLIPVVKGWSTELSIEAANDCIQIHGGMGFIEETGAAQFLRDARITTIYEGTTAIQANDLVQRKLLKDQGAALFVLIADVRQTVALAGSDLELREMAARLEDAIERLESAAQHILERATPNLREVLAIARAFLDMLGTVCGAWQMLRATISSKSSAAQQDLEPSYLELIRDDARIYFALMLPQVMLHAETIASSGSVIINAGELQF